MAQTYDIDVETMKADKRKPGKQNGQDLVKNRIVKNNCWVSE